MQRRKFITRSAQFSLGLGLVGLSACKSSAENTDAKTEVSESNLAAVDQELWFKISLAQWSLNKPLFAGELDNLDFAAKARNDFNIGGVEYVNQFFKDKAEDMAYLEQMNQRAKDNDVTNVLIMIDGEGSLGALDKAERMKAVENHYKWVNAAKTLGCHSIRVNAATNGDRIEGGKAATEGLRALAEYGKKENINVIVENHGGWSSDGEWLSSVIANTEMDNCGTLPDFGNFCIERKPGGWEAGCKTEYDRYKGMQELMPLAKAVSAKANVFGDDGMERVMDYPRILKIVKDHGYRGWIGIEYEGSELSPDEGIRATQALLMKAGKMV